MKSTGGFGRNGPGRPRTRTIVFLTIVIIVSALILLSGSDLKDLNGYYESGSSSSPTSESRQQQQQQQQQQQPPPQQQEHQPPQQPHQPTTPQEPLTPAKSLLDPNVKYLSYLPFAGLTNQFMGLQVGMYAAKLLNRTLIIPPIVSNAHDHDNTHQRWSRYFDMPKFMNLTGVPVEEWDLVRPLTAAQRQVGRDQVEWAQTHGGGESEAWAKVAENVTCQIIYGYGSPRVGTNQSGRLFAWHFLLRMIYKFPPPLQPGMKTWDNVKVSGGQAIQEDLVTIEDLVQRYKDNQDQLLLLSHTFKVRDPDTAGGIYWTEMGAHVHFIPQLMEYATARVNEVAKGDQGIITVPNDDPEEKPDPLLNGADMEGNDDLLGPGVENPNEDATESGDTFNPEAMNITAPTTRIPYIAVHLRRGDIGAKCNAANMEKCMIPFTVYADAVARARTAAANRGLIARLPVVVTTDTQDEKDFQEIAALGWHRLDHDKFGTNGLWGAFGPAM
ncbi:hypothetical protein BGX31_003556, partial [Mortierella sp. GBA43]